MEEDTRMSLLTLAMTDCVMMDRVTTPDGYGGYIKTWNEGAPIQAAIVENNSMESIAAQHAGVTSIYTITTKRAINLQYHDVLKRLSDGKIFRITSDGDDVFTPRTASLDMRNVTAEEWELTNE
jgi:head-tail adaptor